MENFELLKNVYSREEAIEIEDYPYGFRLRTSLFIWLERNKNGYRVCRQTINPTSGKENAIKKSTYYNYIRLYKDLETGYIETYCYGNYNYESYKKAEALGIFETESELETFKALARQTLYISSKYYKENFDETIARQLDLEKLYEYTENLKDKKTIYGD